MKIKARDVGLLAIGFITGAVITLIASTPTRPPTPPAVATGPVLAAASLPPLLTITNIWWQTSLLEIDLPTRFIDSFDPQSPIYPPRPHNLDLIDTRYQPDIKLDDLK